jgi:hypothetical protein
MNNMNIIAVVVFSILLIYLTCVEVDTFLQQSENSENLYSSIMSSFLKIMLNFYILVIVIYCLFFRTICGVFYFIFGIAVNKDYIKTILFDSNECTDLFKFILMNFKFIFTLFFSMSILFAALKYFCKFDEDDNENIKLNYKFFIFSIIVVTICAYWISIF